MRYDFAVRQLNSVEEVRSFEYRLGDIPSILVKVLIK